MKVKVYPSDGSPPFELEAPYITLGNSQSYGPLANFYPHDDEGVTNIIVVNVSNALAVEELD